MPDATPTKTEAQAAAVRWHGVDLRHLAALQAVAEHRSFGRAAKALNVTQSAVSHQIAQLEERLGAVLVDRRSRGGPDLTPAGAVVSRHAAAVFGHLTATVAELDSLASGSGVVRVGVFPSAGAAILPRLIRLLRTRSPGLSVHLHEEPDDAALLKLVDAGQLDLAFVVLPVADDRFATREVVEDPWCIVVRADDIGTIQGLVAAGLGVAILPRMLLTVRHPGVAICTFAEPVEPRRVGIAWSAEHEPAASLRLVVETAVEALTSPLTPTVAGD